jgi:signal transduction histidine kinase
MHHLHEVLSERKSDVLQRWLDEVRGSLHPESMPRVELLDHLPAFIDQLVVSLRQQDAVDATDVAEIHGGQRLALGFSLDSVVREFGAMRVAIVTVAQSVGVTITARDFEVLFDSVINAIAGAVTEYARQRDAEMQRQATEHFAFVAHELRNPLSSAALALTSLENRKLIDMDDRAAQALGRNIRAVHDLIDHSLRVARVGSGIDLNPEPVQLSTLLQDTETSVALNADAKDIRLEVSLEDDHEMFVDVRLVKSALSNLVRNAIKFTHPSGTVVLRGKVLGGRATIEIEDACGGLPPGDVERVFSPFVQLGPEAGSGFGLGLAIARQAMDAHGGSLRVQNLPHKGCIFVLELPTSLALPA